MPHRKNKAQEKGRAKRLKAEAKRLKAEAKRRGRDAAPALSGASLSALLAGGRPVAERLLYDDDLRNNIRTFLESAQKILDELSDDKPSKVVSRLWDDDKLRSQVEAAAGAVQEGSQRVRGENPDKGGNFGKVFLVISAIIAFLMLNPRTGPEARRITKDIYQAVSSSP